MMASMTAGGCGCKSSQLTMAMNNTCWLRKSLHPQYRPQIDLRAWFLAI
jgi:hypothetical protein